MPMGENFPFKNNMHNDLFKSSIFGNSNLKKNMMFTPAELLEINTLLTPENKIVILTHYNPDGDAIGSSLGLKHYLKAKGIHAEVIVPNDFPKFLKWMPEAKKV
jgi:phosphoesterase RecJ-like protein